MFFPIGYFFYENKKEVGIRALIKRYQVAYGFIRPVRLKFYSPIGTGHIVAADFNPPKECVDFYRVPSGRRI